MIKNFTSVWSRIFDSEYNQVTDKRFTESFRVWKRYYDNKSFNKEDLDEWFSNTKQKLNWIINKDSNVLEIGCGNGLISSYLDGKCNLYVGIDNSQICIDKLKLIFKENKKFTFIKEVADSLPIYSDKFDVIIINSVIQYFPNLEYFIHVLQKTLANLKEDGVIFIGDVRSLTHTWYLEKRFKHRFKNFDKFYKIENELLYNPLLFHFLSHIFCKIKLIKIDLKRGYKNNELSRYRYDVFIFNKDFNVFKDFDSCTSLKFKNSRLANLNSTLSSNNILTTEFDGSHFVDYDYGDSFEYLKLSSINFNDNNFFNTNIKFIATNKCKDAIDISSLISLRESIAHE